MDILSVCPQTRNIILELQHIIEESTKKIRQLRFMDTFSSSINATFNQNSIEETTHIKPNKSASKVKLFQSDAGTSSVKEEQKPIMVKQTNSFNAEINDVKSEELKNLDNDVGLDNDESHIRCTSVASLEIKNDCDLVENIEKIENRENSASIFENKINQPKTLDKAETINIINEIEVIFREKTKETVEDQNGKRETKLRNVESEYETCNSDSDETDTEETLSINRHQERKTKVEPSYEQLDTKIDEIVLESIDKVDTNSEYDHVMFLIDEIDSAEDSVNDDISLEEARQQISEYLKLVSVNDLGELTTTTNAAMHYIKVKPGTEPIKQKQRRIMYHFQNDFNKVLDDMIKSGKIQESKSGWASPLRLVGKKDGGVRVTVDYKLLNNVTEKIAYPIPIIDEIFQRLSHAVFYTVLDLTSAYNQVQLDPASRQYTAFICSRGLYEYNVVDGNISKADEQDI